MDTKNASGENENPEEHLQENRGDDSAGLDGSAEEDRDYAFLSETVKKRPVSIRRVFVNILLVSGAAVLFGVIAALVFSNVVSLQNNQNPVPVTIPPDEDSSGNDTSEPALSENSVAETPAPTETPSPTPDPTPTPQTEAEREAESIENYRVFMRSIKKIAETASPSVVTVTGVTSTEDWFNVTAESSRTACGLAVANNGQSLLVLTDYKVADGASRIMVSFSDGSIADAAVQKQDPATSLTIISIPLGSVSADTLAATPLAELGNSYSVSNGDPVIAIGCPLGYSSSYAQGVVTSTGTIVPVTDGEYSLITTNIEGNTTGTGVLINLDGQIVGYMEQKYASEDASVVTAIPISLIKGVIEKLSNNTPISYAGVTGQDISGQYASAAGIPKGIYVTSVVPDSPALAAGIQTADIITSVAGENISTMKEFHDKLLSLSPGDVMAVSVQRKGADGYVNFDFQITLGEKK